MQLATDWYDRLMAFAATALLIAVLASLIRGMDEWYRLSPALLGHLATIIVALALTPVMMLRPRGDTLHRLLGRIWVACLTLTALVSFLIRDINDGGFSLIHLLSAYTLVQAPLIWWHASRHQIGAHRGAVRAMTTGALLIAGFFTFPFNRMLGRWLLG